MFLFGQNLVESQQTLRKSLIPFTDILCRFEVAKVYNFPLDSDLDNIT